MNVSPGPSCGEAISKGFSGICDYSSRSRRSEYWYMVLFNFIIETILSILFNASKNSSFGTIVAIVIIIYSFIMLLIVLPLSIRRLHDIGKSGWFFLIILIPLIGAFILLFFFCQDSQPESNEYGPSPKYTSVACGYATQV